MLSVLNVFTRKWPIPTSLIFTTSGTASSTFELTYTQQQSQPSVPSPPVVFHQMIHAREHGYVLSGRFNGMHVIGKLACNEPGIVLLNAEFDIYQKLHALQASIIPRCFGLFKVEKLGLLILLEDCGRSQSSFCEMTLLQRCV